MSWLLHLVLACVSTQTALSDATTDALVPDVIVPLDIDETSIAAGIEHSCAIQTQSYEDVGGRVVCWGVNNGGQSSPPPGDFIQVSTGRLHSCGIRIDETLECWGIGAPVTKPEGLFEQVSSGDFHSCGIMKDQTIKCWGTAAGGISNAPGGKFVQGQLNADPTARFRQISSSSGDFACGVTEDNTLSCWGDNHRDQASPPTDEKFILVSTSRLAACGVKVRASIDLKGLCSG
uniref:non-specific serine/threonine protein kinase n=1 Tax=Phytophthora ramorum TaxID=164328 RepID=H3GQG3_PHYRM